MVVANRIRNSHSQKSALQGLIFHAVVLTALLFLPMTVISAQETTATVRGTVQDQTDAPLPGTTVRVKDHETGLSRMVRSDAKGQFEFLQLSAGFYEVQASRPGHISQTQSGLAIGTGQLAIVNFKLQGTSEQEGQLAQNAYSEDEDSSSVPSGISEQQLIGLPLNGRSYSQLATLQPGVSDPSSGSASRGGGSGSLTIAGGRSTSNIFLLDGTNIMNTENVVPRSAAGVQLGSDAVMQVQVFSTNYQAEYGRNSGGVLNSITRSGTPEFHGSFFEFFRNSKLDARKFFDGLEPPPFKRNQFGFTLTGPVLRERTFFMVSFEAMRDRLTDTKVDFFPDELARQGIITDAAGEVIRTIPVNPTVKPYLDLYPPLLNSVSFGGGLSRNTSPVFLPTDENFITMRVDHQISERNSLFIRYTFDDATSISPQATFLFTTLNNSRQQYLTLVQSHIFSPNVLNSLRFGYTRPVDASDSLSSIEIPRSLFFVPSAPQFGSIQVPGLSPFGPTSVTPQANRMNSFQFADDVVVQSGAHALKFGLEVNRYRWDFFSNWNKSVVWSFNSLDSYLQGGPEGTTLTVALPGSDNSQAYRQTLMGFYFQDAYAVSSRFQLNLGLRYEFATLIHDKNGKTAFLSDPVKDLSVQIGPLLEKNPSVRNISPRLGITWSPAGNQNTVLRAGFGIYYDQLLGYIYQRRSALPFYKVAVKTNFDSSDDFPNAEKAAIGTPLQAQVLDYRHTTTPMVLRYNFSLQQQLPTGWRAEISYVGTRGNHLLRAYEANLFPAPIIREDKSLFFPPNAGPINPAFGKLILATSDAQSFYNSFLFSLSKSLSRGFSIQSSYTFSKSIDDSSELNNNANQYGLMRTLDRGLSDFDIRHRLVFNYFYTPPLGSGQRWFNSGILANVVGGWRLGGIVRFRTGTPFSPEVNVRTPGYLFAATRPNLLPGKSNNPILGGPDQYFDPSVYSVPAPGTIGNAGRNTITSPSVLTMDVSLQRDFSLDAKRRLQFRAEFFNLPNHSNFSGSSGGALIIFSGTSGRLNPRAGNINRIIGTARQIQLALRLSF